MFHNSALFLKKAAQELAGHSKHGHESFDVDRATLVTVLTQTAVELLSVATVLKHEGIVAVIRSKDRPVDDEAAEASWKAGTIRTKTFEELKSSAAKHFGDDGFWHIVDVLQSNRNKLVHFHTPQSEDDCFDLQYEATHVLIHLVAALTKSESTELAFACNSLLGAKLFHKLISSDAYQHSISALATGIDSAPLRCGACGVRAFLRDDEVCISCGYSGEVKLLKCVVCRQRAVFYDHLNIALNGDLPARCGRCDWEGRVAYCRTCDTDFLFNSHSPADCPTCAWD